MVNGSCAPPPPVRSRRRQTRRTPPTTDVSSDASPTVIEYRHVDTLPEQVQHVQTARFRLRYGRSVLEHLEGICTDWL